MDTITFFSMDTITGSTSRGSKSGPGIDFVTWFGNIVRSRLLTAEPGTGPGRPGCLGDLAEQR